MLGQDGAFFIVDLSRKAEDEIKDDVNGHAVEVLNTLDGLNQEGHSSVSVFIHDMFFQALLVLGVVRNQALELRRCHHRKGVVVHRGDCGRASAVVDNRYFSKVIALIEGSDNCLFAVAVSDLNLAVALADVVERELDLSAVVIIILQTTLGDKSVMGRLQVAVQLAYNGGQETVNTVVHEGQKAFLRLILG